MRSEVGKGTSFTIELPRRIKELEKNEADLLSTISIDIKGKIKVIDDGQDKTNILKMLSQAGHNVTESQDIEDSLKKLATDEYDLLIIDLKKLKVIKNLMVKELNKEWKNQVVFVADFPLGPAIKQKFTQEGILSVSKPIQPLEFFHTLNLALKMRVKVEVPA